tara:strand:+ start:1003 stop:1560 length:558 start_codon:yes stop_codon:yes gene_type:complete
MEEPRLRDAPKLQFNEEEREILDLLKEQYPAIPTFVVEMALDYAKAVPAPGRLTSSQQRKVMRGEMDIKNCPEAVRHLVDAQHVLAEANQKWSTLSAGTKGPGSTVQIAKEVIEVEGAVKIYDDGEADKPVYDEQGKQLSGVGHKDWHPAAGLEDAWVPAENADPEQFKQPSPKKVKFEGTSLKI